MSTTDERGAGNVGDEKALLNAAQIERLELAAKKNRNYIHASDDMFESLVLTSKVPVVVNFWSSWCELCDAIMPLVDKIAGDYRGRLLVTKMDVSMSPKTPRDYKVHTVPYFIYVRGGEVIGSLAGSSNSKLIKFVADHTLT